MPGCFKKTLFALASLISFVSFILIVVAMGIPKWMTGKILCKTGADLVNATDPELVKFIGEIYYGLFRGGKIRQCGLGGRRSKFTSVYCSFVLLKMYHVASNFSFWKCPIYSAACTLDPGGCYDGPKAPQLAQDASILTIESSPEDKLGKPHILPVHSKHCWIMSGVSMAISSSWILISLYSARLTGQVIGIWLRDSEKRPDYPYNYPKISDVFPHMLKKLNTGLHVMIIMFLCVAILFSLVSFGFCILNAIKVPYRAINGPAGACLWNFLAGGFVVLAVTSFMAAVKLHHLTERIANFRENVFQFVILEERFEDCFWICVASATAHAVNLLLIAISGIHFPKIKTKTEEVNVTAEDIMY